MFPHFLPKLALTISHPPARESQGDYVLPLRQVKPGNHNGVNCCSCCIAGECDTLGRHAIRPLPHTLSLRHPRLTSVTVTDRVETVCHSSHSESMANFAPLTPCRSCLWRLIRTCEILMMGNNFRLCLDR